MDLNEIYKFIKLIKLDLSNKNTLFSSISKSILEFSEKKESIIYFIAGKDSKNINSTNDIEKNINLNGLSYIKIINNLDRKFFQKKNTFSFISTVSVLKLRKINNIYCISKKLFENYLVTLIQDELIRSNLNINIFRLGFIKETNKESFLKLFLGSNYKLISKFIFKNSIKNKVGLKIYYFPINWNFLSFIIPLVPVKLLNKFQ